MPRRKKLPAVKPNETAKKLNQVKRWILDGWSEYEIATAAAEEWPGENVKPLIATVMESLCDSAKFDSRVVVGWCFEATRDLYRRMVEMGDYAGALKAVKQLTDLGCRYVPDEEEETEGKEKRPAENVGT